MAGVISREQTDLSTNKSRALWDTDHHFLETYQAWDGRAHETGCSVCKL